MSCCGFKADRIPRFGARCGFGWFGAETWAGPCLPPSFLSSSPAKNRASEGRAVKEASAGLVRPAAQRGLGPARLDGQAPRATVAGKSDELGERRTAANGPGGALKPTPRGERPCVPAARLAGWLLVDQVQPVRCMRGAPSKARRGWAVQPIPWRASAARRPGAKRRPEASGIKAAWPRLGTRRGATPASPTAARRDALLFTTKCK